MKGERFELNMYAWCHRLPVPLGYIDWPDMRTVANEKRNGIQWTLWSLQEDEQPSIDAGKIN